MDDNNEYVDIYSHSSMDSKSGKDAASRVKTFGRDDEDSKTAEQIKNNFSEIKAARNNNLTENDSVKLNIPVGGLSDFNDRKSASAAAEKKKREQKKKRGTVAKFIVIGCIMLLFCGGVAAAAFLTNGFGLITKEPEQSQEPEPQISAQEKVVEQSTQVSEESKEEEINFKTDAKFTRKFDLLSSSVKKALDNEIQSHHVALYDVTSDQIIYEKDANTKCYPASTTKLMTAVVSSKYLKKNDVITVGNEISMIGYDSSIAGLEVGMQLTYEMMLDALMLPSGNDAAYTLAVATAKAYKQDDSLENEECIKIFAELMNKAAKEMGCKGTHFTAPDGFHDDDHYVTAEDMVRIAAYAVKTPIVANSCKKYEATWEVTVPDDNTAGNNEDDENSGSDSSSSGKHTREITWYNSNQLLEKDGGQYSKFATGLKTGFTDEAWTCLVSSAEMSNHTMIAVVMKSPSNYQKYHESNLLFTVGFNLFDLKYKHNDEWVN